MQGKSAHGNDVSLRDKAGNNGVDSAPNHPAERGMLSRLCFGGGDKMNPLVSCLTATRGRLRVLQEAVACYLAQDYENKEMVILNNHPVPLELDNSLTGKGIRIVNEAIYPNLGSCRIRMLELANGEYIRTWDDDDLYLPWAISQGMENIGSFVAFKPKKSWDSRKNSIYTLGENVYEASITFRADHARLYGYQPTGGDEHDPLMKSLDNSNCLVKDVKPSYCYRWDSGLFRISGTLGNGDVETRTKNWEKANQDIGDGVIRQVPIQHYFDAMKGEMHQYDCIQ